MVDKDELAAHGFHLEGEDINLEDDETAKKEDDDEDLENGFEDEDEQ